MELGREWGPTSGLEHAEGGFVEGQVARRRRRAIHAGPVGPACGPGSLTGSVPVSLNGTGMFGASRTVSIAALLTQWLSTVASCPGDGAVCPLRVGPLSFSGRRSLLGGCPDSEDSGLWTLDSQE